MPTLRQKQVDQLAFYIANPKCLDTSHPGTGKTPPVCVYSYWHWLKNQKKTLWTMPKSLLKKNLKEMLRFTDFEPEDVVILRTDRANMTKDYTGPTINAVRKKRGFVVNYNGQRTDTIAIRETIGQPVNFVYMTIVADILDVGPSFKFVETPLNKPSKNGQTIVVEPVFGPDGVTPKVIKLDEIQTFKDLIKQNANAKVFITTFKFGSNHWQRLLEAAPDIDLFISDELHMPGGYSTPETKTTESFFWINKHVSRFVGMTGTLINGRLDSAFPSLHVIEPRYYGDLNGFMLEHAAVTDDYGRVIVWKNEDRLRKILEKHSIQRTFEEVYGKEDVVFFTEYVDIGEEVEPFYAEFHEQAMLELEDGRVLDGQMAGVAQIRARQILAHPETMFNNIPQWTPKDERVQIHLSEGKKTLIFASLKPEQERLVRVAEDMGLRVGLVNSDVTGKARERVDELAQAGLLDVIVASGPTAAVGFNWEMFDVVIFASVDFMDTNILQAYRRASRGTRTSTLRVIYIRYRDTIEDRMYAILTAKSQLANLVDPSRPVLTFSEE
jgi:hypothetical protein